MAEAKKSESVSKKLTPVAEVTDPAVQQVVAELETAKLNNDKTRVEALRKQLADQGYRAG